METIIKIIGGAQIVKVERRDKGIIGWERRTGYLGFEGYLVIKLGENGRSFACIDNGRRCISTSYGELSLSGSTAVFKTANSIYTFRLTASEQAG